MTRSSVVMFQRIITEMRWKRLSFRIQDYRQVFPCAWNNGVQFNVMREFPVIMFTRVPELYVVPP